MTETAKLYLFFGCGHHYQAKSHLKAHELMEEALKGCPCPDCAFKQQLHNR